MALALIGSKLNSSGSLRTCLRLPKKSTSSVRTWSTKELTQSKVSPAKLRKPTLSTSGPNASHHLDWVNENTVQRCLTKSRHVIVTVIANTVTGS